MSQPNLCPNCGGRLPDGALDGLCPRCLLRQAMAMQADAPSTSVATTYVPAGPRSLEDSLGPIPRVFLPGVDGDASPVASPTSAEMPDLGGSGRYQLLGEIARGGMGAVLKGRDESLGRDLAVKVLLEAHRDRPPMVRRFVEEAQIGGQLQHPGIVPVYELGVFPDRRPYFTMKLVRGRTLADLLDARPDPALDRPRFLAVFEQICQTVAYAHAHKVVHRDLKPSNVMVGSFGEVQVMDWGLAKVLSGGDEADADGSMAVTDPEPPVRTGRSGSGADASKAGSVMGTPSYMAPEQARGEVDRLDERADVFALGAILCEVLTGRPPFAGQSYAETLERAAAGDTREALARLDASGADPELLGLVRRCLDAEPRDRPRDAGEVAHATTAYLAGVQERLRAAELASVEAKARAVEERKRRRVVIGFAAGLLSVFALGALGVATEWRRAESHLAAANTANAQLVAANAQEVRARTQAMARLDLAMAAVERFHEGVGGELILREPTMQPLRARLLGSALEFYTKLQRVLEAEPGASAGAELARAYERVGKLSRETGAKAAGAEAFAKALAIRERIARDRPGDVAARADVAGCRAMHATALDESNRVPEARDAYLRVVDEYEGLVRDRPDPSYVTAAAKNALRLGQLLRLKLGRTEQAERYVARAESDLEALDRGRPGNARIGADLAEARAAHATLFWGTKRPIEALAAMRRSVADYETVARGLPDDDPVHARLGAMQINYGTMLAQSGRPEEALAAYRRAEAVFERLTARTPNLTDCQSYLAHARKSQGWLLKRLDRPGPALEQHRRALPVWERLARDYPEVALYQDSLSSMYIELGDTLRAAGRPAEALAELRRAVDLRDRQVRARPDDVELRSELADAHIMIASTLAAMGRPAESAAEYLRVLDHFAAHPSPLPSDMYNAGCACARLAVLGRDGRGPANEADRREAAGRLDQAMRWLRRAADSGSRDLRTFRDDPDLAPLRPRVDFRLFMMDLAMPDDPFVPAS